MADTGLSILQPLVTHSQQRVRLYHEACDLLEQIDLTIMQARIFEDTGRIDRLRHVYRRAMDRKERRAARIRRRWIEVSE